MFAKIMDIQEKSKKITFSEASKRPNNVKKLHQRTHIHFWKIVTFEFVGTRNDYWYQAIGVENDFHLYGVLKCAFDISSSFSGVHPFSA